MIAAANGMLKNMNESLTLADLKFEGKNPRNRTQRSLAQTENSLQKYGAWRSVAADENLNVIAGRGTCEAAANVGIERVKRVDADGNELVVVVRHGLTEQQKMEYMIADNRCTDLSEFDGPVIKEFGEQIDLRQQFFDYELKRLYAKTEEPIEVQAKQVLKCPECGHEFTP